MAPLVEHPQTASELPDLATAKETCRAITFAKARNFAYAFLFIPRRQREQICVAYAWCRLVDDIADEESVPIEERAKQLDEEEQRLLRLADGAAVEAGPKAAVYVALKDLLQNSGVRVEDLRDLIVGMRQDLTKTRYANFEELYDYCYHAASTVGLICLEIFGYSAAGARALGVEMGIALQLTNILRDVAEDLERDRIYLPADELESYGISEADLRAGVMTPDMERYFRFFAHRALRYYQRSEGMLSLVPKSTRLCPHTLHHLYRSLLLEILGRRCDVLSGRTSLSKPRKLSLALRLWLRSFLYV